MKKWLLAAWSLFLMAQALSAEQYPTGMVEFRMQRDTNGCRIYAPVLMHPFLEQEAELEWTGLCRSGFASGYGVLHATFGGTHLYTSSYTNEFSKLISFVDGYPIASQDRFAETFYLDHYSLLFRKREIRCPENGRLDLQLEGIPLNGFPRGDLIVSLIIAGFIFEDINAICNRSIKNLRLLVYSKDQGETSTIFESEITGGIHAHAALFDREYSLRHSDKWTNYFSRQ